MLLNKWIILLIQQVKQRRILYDNNHPARKNYSTKEKVWQDIARKLNKSVNEVKTKWKSFRDMYIKHLKSNSSDGTSKKYKAYKSWRWARYMAFLRPHVDGSAGAEEDYANSNVIKVLGDFKVEKESSCEDSEVLEFVEVADPGEISVQLGSKENGHGERCPEDGNDLRKNGRFISNQPQVECYIEKVHLSGNKRQRQSKEDRSVDDELYFDEEITQSKGNKRKRNNSTCVQEEQFLAEKLYANSRGRQSNRFTVNRAVEMDNDMHLDALEHLFMGYAKTIKNLPIKSQIHIKMKIAKLIMEEEIKCLQ